MIRPLTANGLDFLFCAKDSAVNINNVSDVYIVAYDKKRVTIQRGINEWEGIMK